MALAALLSQLRSRARELDTRVLERTAEPRSARLVVMEDRNPETSGFT